MPDILNVFDSITIISIITLTCGFFSLALKTCFRSKCSKFTLFWGLCDVERNTHDEIEEMRIGVDQRTLARDETNNV